MGSFLSRRITPCYHYLRVHLEEAFCKSVPTLLSTRSLFLLRSFFLSFSYSSFPRLSPLYFLLQPAGLTCRDPDPLTLCLVRGVSCCSSGPWLSKPIVRWTLYLSSYRCRWVSWARQTRLRACLPPASILTPRLSFTELLLSLAVCHSPSWSIRANPSIYGRAPPCTTENTSINIPARPRRRS